MTASSSSDFRVLNSGATSAMYLLSDSLTCPNFWKADLLVFCANTSKASPVFSPSNSKEPIEFSSFPPIDVVSPFAKPPVSCCPTPNIAPPIA